jgi:hypothetical protein
VDDPRDLLRRESRSLVQRLRLWTPTRFAAQAPTHGTRGDLVHHLAQRLADAAAEAEGGAQRALPRMDGDLVLPDQLAVTADDLARAAGPAAARAATAHLLLHRRDLLDEEVPPGLAAALGLDDVLAAGREECGRTA